MLTKDELVTPVWMYSLLCCCFEYISDEEVTNGWGVLLYFVFVDGNEVLKLG